MSRTIGTDHKLSLICQFPYENKPFPGSASLGEQSMFFAGASLPGIILRSLFWGALSPGFVIPQFGHYAKSALRPGVLPGGLQRTLN